MRTFPGGQTLAGAVTRVQGSTDARIVLPSRTVLGFGVVVTVSATRYVWDFGDGEVSSVPVGSGHPVADHVYRTAGPLTPSLRAFYSGSFTIAGSAQVYQLDGLAEVPGQPQPLTVREARTQLEAGSG